MMVITTMYFSPDWPLRVFRFFTWRKQDAEVHRIPRGTKKPLRAGEWLILIVMAVFFTHQILYPLRNFIMPGNVVWNEEGHRFSWRMKVKKKNPHIDNINILNIYLFFHSLLVTR